MVAKQFRFLKRLKATSNNWLFLTRCVCNALTIIVFEGDAALRRLVLAV